VNIDSTRSRIVRERNVSEFRVSFRVDLERLYDVTYVEPRSMDRSHIVSGEAVSDDE
jgi:hypothetical protein